MIERDTGCGLRRWPFWRCSPALRSMLVLLAGATVAGSAPAGGESVAGGSDTPFALTPQPRWTEDPETEKVCAAIARECPGALREGEVEADVGYDELYDARGMLAGLRLTRSTGCKPLDEHALLSHRAFRMAFHHDDQPDLDNIHAELAPGIDPAGVRIVKASGSSLSIGCN